MTSHPAYVDGPAIGDLPPATRPAYESTVVRAIDPRDLPRVPRLLLVTKSTHPISECAGCAKAARSAEIHARVTGSVGATWTDDNSLVGRESHSVTVAGSRA